MLLYNPTVSGSLLVTGSLTTTGTLTAQTLVVQTITSSVDFVTGSSVNGSLSSNTHQFTGSVLMSGSLNVGGDATFPSSVSITTNGNPLFLNNSANTTSIGMKFTNGGGNYFIGVSNSGGTGYLSGPAYAFNIQSEGAQALQFGTNNANRMIITSSGSVGIGTTSPNYTLHIDSNTTLTRFQITNSTTGQGAAVGLQIIQNGLDTLITNRSNGYLGFETNSTERIRITSSGSVAIGRSTPENGVKLLIADAGGIGMEFSPNANVPNENRLLSYDRVAGTTIPMNYSAASHKLYTGYNNLQTSTKTASSGGNTTFSIGTDYGFSLSDNNSGIVIISISQTNANVTNPSAVWIGTVINPRGSGSTTTQISTTKAAGISTLSVSGNGSNQIVVTASTSDGSGYRASLTFIGGGGTT